MDEKADTSSGSQFPTRHHIPVGVFNNISASTWSTIILNSLIQRAGRNCGTPSGEGNRDRSLTLPLSTRGKILTVHQRPHRLARNSPEDDYHFRVLSKMCVLFIRISGLSWENQGSIQEKILWKNFMFRAIVLSVKFCRAISTVIRIVLATFKLHPYWKFKFKLVAIRFSLFKDNCVQSLAHLWATKNHINDRFLLNFHFPYYNSITQIRNIDQIKQLPRLRIPKGILHRIGLCSCSRPNPTLSSPLGG